MGNGLVNALLGSLSHGEISYKHFLLTLRGLEALRELLESFDEHLSQMY